MVAPIDKVFESVKYEKVSEAVEATIFTKEAVAFVATLNNIFNGRRKELLESRRLKQEEIDGGKFPTFLPETAHIREDPTWQGPPTGPGLQDRRAEITGPTDRKMVINALNSNVYAFMADFEDANSPSWSNMTEGQLNLYDAIRETITLETEKKSYKLNKFRKNTPDTLQSPNYPTLIARPRGWHMEESHFTVDGKPVSAAIFDFGFYFFHNAKELIARGTGPYFYLPKTQSYLEARLWNDIFNVAQDWVGIPKGTIRATVLIETIHAAFQMDEIIYELRNHCAGLNCGRWDYIFSFSKTFKNHKEFTLPDRDDVTMTSPFMAEYVKALVKTCHKRGVHAMGGMAAQIPIKNNEEANNAAIEKVYQDKLREASVGHDGTWVAHPGLAATALEAFNEHMPGPNQIYKQITDWEPTVEGLLNYKIPNGKVTNNGVKKNLDIAIAYMTAWLKGSGAVAINNLMEDAATAEVSRVQLHTWIKHEIVTAEGVKVTKQFVTETLNEVMSNYTDKEAQIAFAYLNQEISNGELADFLTTPLYSHV